MQLTIEMKFDGELVFPIGHHHIMQSVIYHNLKNNLEYSNYLHNQGYLEKNRRFKMFTFGPLNGRYQIRNKEICFLEQIRFEVRSPETMMIRTLEDSVRENGIIFGEKRISKIYTRLNDKSVEKNRIQIRMQSPITTRSTDASTKKTVFYHPDDPEFSNRINGNFIRKYKAFFGVEPTGGIQIESVRVTDKDRYITQYKGFVICGWLGEYILSGERKYLDFLYQTGLGEKNAQGFGMFDVLSEMTESYRKEER